MGLGQVFAPKVQLHPVEVEQQVGAQRGVEVLISVVGLGPISAAEAVGVGAKGQRLEQRAAEGQGVVGHQAHVVHGDEGHVIVGVILSAARVVVVEDGMGEAVVEGHCEPAVEEVAAQGGFDAAAVAAPGVDHDAAHAAVGEARNLLVVGVDKEERQVGRQRAVEEVKMGAGLVVPAKLGAVSHRGPYVGRRGAGHALVHGLLDAQEHLAHCLARGSVGLGLKQVVAISGRGGHQVLLQSGAHDVRKHLYIVSARAVPLRKGEVEVAAVAPKVILQGQLGQQARVVVRHLALQVRARGERGRLNHRHGVSEVDVVTVGGEVQLLVLIVHPGAGREREARQQQVVKGGLHEGGAVEHRRAHAVLQREHRVGQGQRLTDRNGATRHGVGVAHVGKHSREQAVDHLHPVGVEHHRGLRAQVLPQAEQTARPFQPTAGRALHHKLLRQGVRLLTLFQRVVVETDKVLVHHHAVVQPLVARHRKSRKVRLLHLGLEGRTEQVAAVAARAVGRNAVEALRQRLGACDRAGIEVGIRVLVGIFVVAAERQEPLPVGLEHQPQAAARLLLATHLLAEKVVAVDAARVAIKAAGREGQLTRKLLIGQRRKLRAAVARRRAGGHFCILSGKGVVGVDADNAAHGVAAVKRALRPAQHVDAVDAEQVEIVAALVDRGHVVDIHRHGRRIDARAHAADVDGRRLRRAVVGHEKVGGKARKVAQSVHAHVLQRVLREERHRSFGLAQPRVFLRRGNDHHLFHVDHARRVGGCRNGSGRSRQIILMSAGREAEEGQKEEE